MLNAFSTISKKYTSITFYNIVIIFFINTFGESFFALGKNFFKVKVLVYLYMELMLFSTAHLILAELGIL